MALVDIEGVEMLYGASGYSLEELTGVTGASNDIGIDKTVTNLVTTGASSGALADGVKGQIKYIILKTDGGTYTLTPANFANGTTIAFDDANDYIKLIFDGTNWVSLGGTATVA